MFVPLCIDLASPPLILPRSFITLVCLMSGGVEVCVSEVGLTKWWWC